MSKLWKKGQTGRGKRTIPTAVSIVILVVSVCFSFWWIARAFVSGEVSLFKDPLAYTVVHCALFILIRPEMGSDLSRGKFTASHLEEEMNTEFEMLVVSNFLVSTSSLVRYQKPVKYFCGLCFGPLNPPSCSSRRGHFLRLQKSHLKEK